MLVLTRKVGESIAIGDAITIKVVEIRGGQVRVGIEAPMDMRVYRGEIYEKVQRENQLAARWSMNELRAVVNLMDLDGKEL